MLRGGTLAWDGTGRGGQQAIALQWLESLRRAEATMGDYRRQLMEIETEARKIRPPAPAAAHSASITDAAERLAQAVLTLIPANHNGKSP